MSTTELNRRIGGPVGEHALRKGLWFDPVPWTILVALATWLVLMWHQYPCRQTTVGKPVNALMRLCYSDIPLVYQGSGWATGQVPYRDFDLAYGPVTAGLMVVARWITRLLGFASAPGVSAQRQLDASWAWFLVTAVILFLFFLALCLAHVLIGRGSSQEGPGGLTTRVRSWDALFVAGAPVVAAAGLVNWDVLAAALTGLALLAWAVRRPGLAGVFLGLGIGTKFYPVFVLLGLVLLCWRAGRLPAARRVAATTVATWVVVNLPVAVLSPHRWAAWYTGWATAPADLGSVWYVLSLVGVTVPRPGLIGALLFVAVAAFVTQRILLAPRRPRVGQVCFLLVAGFVLTAGGYPPQRVVWVLPLLVLARPVLIDWAGFTIAELLYFWAVWGHLDGHTYSSGNLDAWYIMAVIVRVAMLVWIALRVLHDISRPWDDPVRQPFVDDPAGGVLDHASDAILVPAARPVPQPADAGQDDRM